MKEKGFTGFGFKDAEGEDDIVSRLATLKINVNPDSPTTKVAIASEQNIYSSTQMFCL